MGFDWVPVVALGRYGEQIMTCTAVPGSDIVQMGSCRRKPALVVVDAHQTVVLCIVESTRLHFTLCLAVYPSQRLPRCVQLSATRSPLYSAGTVYSIPGIQQ